MSKKKTNEEFLQKLKEKGLTDIQPLKEYVNNQTKILFKCLRDESHPNWEATPKTILNGCGCPSCSGRAIITESVFLKRVEDMGLKMKLITDFKGLQQPVDFQCEYGHIWHLNSAKYVFHRNKSSCPYCDGTIIKKGVNTFGDLFPNLLKYFKDEEQAFQVGSGACKNFDLICPECGTERKMLASTLARFGFNCQICGPNVSLPNRVIRKMLLNIKEQLDFCKFEYTNAEILGRQMVDVYFEKDGEKYAIEMQGRQHYKHAPKSYYRGTEHDIDYFDELKRQKLQSGNIKEIEIECIKTDVIYIKNKILESELKDILDLSKVEWDKVFEDCYESDIKKACELYNSKKTIKDIAKEIGFCKDTITDYLKRGASLGWCNYIAIPKYNGPRKACKVEVLNDNKEVIYTFDSYNKAAIQLSNGEYSYNGYGVGLHAKDGKKYHEYYFRRVEN